MSVNADKTATTLLHDTQLNMEQLGKLNKKLTTAKCQNLWNHPRIESDIYISQHFHYHQNETNFFKAFSFTKWC